MSRTLAVLVLLAQAGLIAQSPAKAPIPATIVTAADIQAVEQSSIANKTSDVGIRTVDAGGHNVGIGVVYRGKGNNLMQASSHDKVTEVYYILQGSGTLVTGGTLVKAQRREGTGGPVQLNGPSVSGTGIDGGVSHHVVKGDMAIIPAGTPHLFSDVEETITLAVVRIDPAQVTPQK